MEREKKARSTLNWRDEMPTENGLYDYQGTLYGLHSDATIECNPYCEVNIRKGDGPRMSIHGEDGVEYDIAKTGGGKWRGPLGPVHIPVEDARREGR